MQMERIARAVFGQNRKISQREGRGLPMLVTIATISGTIVNITAITNVTHQCEII